MHMGQIPSHMPLDVHTGIFSIQYTQCQAAQLPGPRVVTKCTACTCMYMTYTSIYIYTCNVLHVRTCMYVYECVQESDARLQQLRQELAAAEEQCQQQAEMQVQMGGT